MPEISPLEILMVAAIALIVFGPERLPDIARSAGRGLAQLRRVATEVRSEFESEVLVEDDESDEQDRG